MNDQAMREIADEFCDANIAKLEIELEIAKTGRDRMRPPPGAREAMMLVFAYDNDLPPRAAAAAARARDQDTVVAQLQDQTQRLVAATARHDAAKEALDDVIGEWLETHPPTPGATHERLL